MERVVWERRGSREGCMGEIGEWRGLCGRDREVERVVWGERGEWRGLYGRDGEVERVVWER